MAHHRQELTDGKSQEVRSGKKAQSDRGEVGGHAEAPRRRRESGDDA